MVAYRKEWSKQNPEKIKEYKSIDQKIHKEKRNTRKYEWNSRNLAARNTNNQNYKAKKKGNGGTYTVKQWESLKQYYDYQCLCCKRYEPEIKLTADHVLPISLGGANTINNIQPLCGSCNSSKKNKYIDYRG